MAISTAQDYVNQLQRNIADQINANFSPSQLLGMVNEARTRVSLDTHGYRTYLTGLNTISQVEQYPYSINPASAPIGGVNVTNGGSGYSAATEVSIVGGGGSGAAAYASISAGVIQNIFMSNWGTGYSSLSPPTIMITDTGGGTGAAATPIILSNIIDVMSIDILWGTLRQVFAYLPFTGFNTYARAYTKLYSIPGVFTLHQGLQTAFMYPIPDQEYAMSWDIISTTTDLASLSTPETQLTAPWNDAVQWYATFLALTSMQQYEKAKFFYDPQPDGRVGGIYGGRVKQLPATAFSRRVMNPYRTYWPMVRKI